MLIKVILTLLIFVSESCVPVQDISSHDKF